MASIRDVAKRAGVGVGTVSRMINDSGYVSLETREKIEIAMKELNYTPNELARNLYYKRTGIIAVLVPSIANPFFSQFINHIEDQLYAYGYKMMACNTGKGENAEREFLDMLNRHIVDGVITGVHTLDSEIYHGIQKPIVALDRYLGDNIPVVAVDHKEGGRLAAEILVKNSCKKVLHFRGSKTVESPYHERHNEFERIMKKNNVKTINYDLEHNRFDREYYSEVVKKVFAQKTDFDGVFAVDELAIECMNESIRQGKNVPKDIKFVAYDGTYITRIVEPMMTAIVQPIEDLAKEAVRMLNNMIMSKETDKNSLILRVNVQAGGTAGV